MDKESKSYSRWYVNRESLLPLIIGIFAYVGLETLFVLMNIPHQMFILVYVAFFPAIAIPMVMGARYGPIIGFLTGFGGKLLADAILYGGIWILWPFSFGIMGLIPGLISSNYYIGKYTKGPNLIRLSLFSLLAALVGSLIPSIISIFIEQLGLFLPLVFYFIPLFFTATFNGVLLSPILARSIEYFETKSSAKTTAAESPQLSTVTNQIGLFFIAFCFLMSFGLFILKDLSTFGEHGSCCIGVPFGHELTGSLMIVLELGMYLFLGFGIIISLILVIRWIYFEKIRK
ncbi:MAG: ECF transporter S component [Candidatus Helarchaeota archaeon]